MEKIRTAAIILLGLGEKAASDILKTMSPKEVRAIIEAINDIDNVSEEEVIKALNEFFKETSGRSGIDVASREQVKHSLLSVVGAKGIGNIIPGINSDKDQWLDNLKNQPMSSIVELIQDEHPQIITTIVIIVFNYMSSESGTKLIKSLPKELQYKVFKRMTSIGTISKLAIDSLSTYFQREFEDVENSNSFSVDGIETVANIISYLDSETEHQIINELSNANKVIGEKIQDKIFPFQRLAELDRRSFQILLAEVKNEDLLMALKGVDEHVKNIFMQNMSSKSAEILKDEMESKGPVKLAAVMDAQKKIIRIAKKLDKEEKIILSSKNNPDVVF